MEKSARVVHVGVYIDKDLRYPNNRLAIQQASGKLLSVTDMTQAGHPADYCGFISRAVENLGIPDGLELVVVHPGDRKRDLSVEPFGSIDGLRQVTELLSKATGYQRRGFVVDYTLLDLPKES